MIYLLFIDMLTNLNNVKYSRNNSKTGKIDFGYENDLEGFIMIKFGIIGTNWITQQFVSAAHETHEWKLNSVYSRSLEKAQSFGEKNQASEYFEDLDDFFSKGDFSTVYIASPNSLHFEQAKMAIENNKSAIVEKPIVENPGQFEQLLELLKKHPQVRLFEAARHLHEANFKAIQQKISEMKLIQGATLTYMKYSSRYDALLEGQEPNIFSLNFAGGALQDLGVYVAYDAVSWFGMPEEVAYFPSKIRTGVDGSGIAVLRYPEFDVTLNIGKNKNSYLPSEIYGLKDTILMDNAAELGKVDYIDVDGNNHSLGGKPDANPMLSEAKDFAEIINNMDDTNIQNNYNEWLEISQNVNKLLFSLRQNGKIYFTDEK